MPVLPTIDKSYQLYLFTSKLKAMPNESSWTSNVIPEIELRYSSKVKVSTLPIVSSSKDAYHLLITTWTEGKIAFVEQFRVILLNRSKRVLGICTLTSGSSTNAIADPKLVFALALKGNANSIILAHNHPSGQLMPSENDRNLTTKMKAAGKLLELQLVDHLIVTNEGYYSFNDEGVM